MAAACIGKVIAWEAGIPRALRVYRRQGTRSRRGPQARFIAAQASI